MIDYAEVPYDAVKMTTEKAVCLEIDEEEIWIPLSCTDGDDFDDEGPGVALVAEWFATKEGLV